MFSFPIAAPEESITVEDLTAIAQLELWLTYQRHWCEHKPSITVYIKEHEWMEVGAWVWEHFDEISGISFLPYVGHTYQQAPYQPITKKEFEEFFKFWDVSYEAIEYEVSDKPTHALFTYSTSHLKKIFLANAKNLS